MPYDEKTGTLSWDESTWEPNKARELSMLKIKIDNFVENAKLLYRYQPYFYDQARLWWLWRNNRWEIVDDVDMARMLDDTLGFMGQTVGSQLRNNHLQAMMWVGREKHPKPAPTKWIQFKDKAFSLKSKKIYQVTPHYFFTNPIPWELGATSDTPTMDRLFEDWAGKEYVKSLYQVIAYCCYQAYPIHTVICLFGSGRNGKSQYLKIVQKFLGKDNLCTADFDMISQNRFDTFGLYRKLCCLVGETNYGVLEKSDKFKKLSCGDPINFEKKGKDDFMDVSYATLLLASNSLPSTEDQTDGFARRWFIIDFPHEFPEGKDIIDTIPEIEYNNLARKCVELLPELLETGQFEKQGTIPERRMKYTLASNPLPYFIENYCDKDANAYMLANELYTQYVGYLIKNKRRVIKWKNFRDALTNEGYFIEKSNHNINGQYVSGQYIQGLVWRREGIKKGDGGDVKVDSENCDDCDSCARTYPIDFYYRGNSSISHNCHNRHNFESTNSVSDMQGTLFPSKTQKWWENLIKWWPEHGLNAKNLVEQINGNFPDVDAWELIRKKVEIGDICENTPGNYVRGK